jgi:hypothetical protein
MRLEGTLDAFSLPDIFQLLSYTKKTGTLHLRRDAQHGVVHLRDGAVTGGRGDVRCQALGRRLVGAGLVGDDALADAVEQVLDEPGSGLGKALVAAAGVDAELARALAAEQATDAVFELLRWESGEFTFVVDEADPDDLGAALPVEQVVAEGRRRLETWQALTVKVPSPTAVVTLTAAPATDPVLSREEWALLSLLDGHRTVADLVLLSGTGEYVVVSALADLAERGLVTVGERAEGVTAVAQRQQLLAALESGAATPPAPEAAPVKTPERKAVIPERPEPFTPERRPDYAEEPVPALTRMAASAARATASAPSAKAASAPVTAKASSPAASASARVPSASAASVGAVQGAHALQPDAVPAAATLIDRDPSVNKSLLLRLIAGVRGL